jgi:ABC-type branched-subunit amino acid transport system substrate-binding protein
VEAAKSYDFDKVKKEFENIKNYDGIIGKISFSASNHLGIQDSDVGLGAANDYTAPESLGFLPQLKTA